VQLDQSANAILVEHLALQVARIARFWSARLVV
jgi:hypothetical protein